MSIASKTAGQSSERNLEPMVMPLLAWYDENKRSMVWRDNPTPYHVWISEIMLQQTRIEAAKSYFLRFTEEIPDIQTLADIEDERLMKLWEGLGYYNRARNLKKAAKVLVERYDGKMPADYDLLLELPGIGPYTAGAIASIAYNQKAAAVDGNVLRVVTRYLALPEDIMKMSFRNQVAKELVRIMPERSGDFNQAIMELGEVICIPNGAPLCNECPLRGECKAFHEEKQMDFPVKPEKKQRKIEKRTVIILEHGNKVAIQKRPEQGLLAGLWEFGSLEGRFSGKGLKKRFNTDTKIKKLHSGIHIFSHVEWHMDCYRISLDEPAQWETDLFSLDNLVWVSFEQLQRDYTLPVAFHSFRNQIFAEKGLSGR